MSPLNTGFQSNSKICNSLSSFILASLGSGAIIGGVAGGALGSVEASTPIFKKAGEFISDKGKKFLDPKDALLDYLNVSEKIKLF